MDSLLIYSNYSTSLEEIGCGLLLLAITIGIHTYGMMSLMRYDSAFQLKKVSNKFSMARAIFRIIILSWGIILVHLVEVGIWGAFFTAQEIAPNFSTGFYWALMDYTTLGCDLSMPARWRLLEGMVAIAGVLTFAWSTGMMFSVINQMHSRHRESVFEP